MIDTNIVFEGLTHLGPSAKVLDAWAERRFLPCVSTALALEYQAVLQSKLAAYRRETVSMALQGLLARCEYVPIYFSYRPASRDPGDDLVVDCVVNSRAVLVTSNTRDFLGASQQLGFPVLRPEIFLSLIREDVQP
ncbi:MAG: putative toxin-antitoxin system toxin component, PIN family [Thermoanaerobaculia bacterium]